MPNAKAITLKQLRALSAIVQSGSITAAARLLHVTPPAVSTQLKTLEEAIDARVMHRGPDGTIALTLVGEEMLQTARKIEIALEQSVERIRAIQSGRAGYVSIGVVSTGKYFAPGLVSDLKTRHPEIEIGLRVGNRDAMIEALARGEVELAIMGRPPQVPEVEAEELGPHPYIMIAPPTHRLTHLEAVTSDALLRETFLGREEGSGTRILMRRYLDRIGEGRPYRMIEMGTNETIKQAVMAGLGIAVISAHTVVPELEAGRLVTIPAEGLPLMRKWYLVRLKGLDLSPTAAAFQSFVLELDGTYLPQLPRPMLIDRWEDIPV